MRDTDYFVPFLLFLMAMSILGQPWMCLGADQVHLGGRSNGVRDVCLAGLAKQHEWTRSIDKQPAKYRVERALLVGLMTTVLRMALRMVCGAEIQLHPLTGGDVQRHEEAKGKKQKMTENAGN